MSSHDVHEGASGAAYRGSIGCEIREPAGYPRRAMSPAAISYFGSTARTPTVGTSESVSMDTGPRVEVR